MKSKILCLFLSAGVLLLAVIACRKSKTTASVNAAIAFPQEINLNACTDGPDYGSEVICQQWRGPNKDYTIKPKNNPGAGKYYAWPQGLVINENTGEINVTKSESGARYVIGFLKAGTNDTCLSELILAGATYVDSVHVLENNDTLAVPYFNANPTPTTVCDDSDDNDYPGSGNPGGGGNDRCEFDDGADDDNGNGPSDEPPGGQRANDQQVRVRTLNGVINLKKTLEDGGFGPNPQNGDTKDVTIYYRLNDCSMKAMQRIRINLIYYEKISDIPVQLMNDVRNKRTSFMQARIIDPNGKPRPPQIIVTRYAY